MARKLQYDIPGTDWRVSLDEVREKGWSAIFEGRQRPLVVEIGFGRGEFLMDLAERDPEQPLVGIEYSAKRTLKMARRLARTELRNVRLLSAPAEEMLRDALQDGSVARFWINFPDPWPKKRHWKRRLLQPAVVALLARRLAPGGALEIATDHPDYAEWIDEVLRATPGLRNCRAPRAWLPDAPAGRLATAYEREWRALGRGFHFFSYQRSV